MAASGAGDGPQLMECSFSENVIKADELNHPSCLYHE